MNRQELISYSFFYGGEYNKIIRAISQKKHVDEVYIENAVTIFDREYPERLLELKYPPLVLYYKGDLSLLKKEAVAVIGSRKPCEYALKATQALVRGIDDHVVISGLAKGIDACAHEYASETIGILGCGIDYIYPYCNKELITKVGKEGLILSEYPSMVKPYACHFPFRNRIIAALSERLYIMQSAEKSGTMTTVNEALELGKEIRVLPYDIFNADGVHNMRLIYEGAIPVMRDEIAFCQQICKNH